MPFKESLDDSTLPFGMSPPQHSEELVKESLLAAISTPMMDIYPKKDNEQAEEFHIPASPPFAVLNGDQNDNSAVGKQDMPHVLDQLSQNFAHTLTTPSATQPIIPAHNYHIPSKTTTHPNPPPRPHANSKAKTHGLDFSLEEDDLQFHHSEDEVV